MYNMEINKTITLSSQIKVGEQQVGYLNANVSTEALSISISANINNKDLAQANAELIKEQYLRFETEVKNTAAELGCLLI